MVKVNDNIQKQMDSEKEYAIKISFEKLTDTYRHLELRLAPESIGKQELLIPDSKTQSIQYQNIVNFIVDTSNLLDSQCKGQVNMKVCQKCKHHSQKQNPSGKNSCDDTPQNE